MGLKIQHHQNKKEREASPMRRGEEQLTEEFDQNSTQRQEHNAIVNQLKKNWFKLLFVLLSIGIMIWLMSQTNDYLEEIIRLLTQTLKEISLREWFLLVGLGTVMILIGAPILFLEITIGMTVRNFIVGVSIPITSKLLGIFLSYAISNQFLVFRLEYILDSNKYLRAIKQVSLINPKKGMFLLGVVQIPMLIKNYSLPLFKVSVTDILLYFCSVQIFQSILFCFVASTFDNSQDSNWILSTFKYLSYLLTIAVFIYIYKQTKKILILEESSYITPHNSLNDIELDSQNNKISYNFSKQLDSPNQVTLIDPLEQQNYDDQQKSQQEKQKQLN